MARSVHKSLKQMDQLLNYPLRSKPPFSIWHFCVASKVPVRFRQQGALKRPTAKLEEEEGTCASLFASCAVNSMAGRKAWSPLGCNSCPRQHWNPVGFSKTRKATSPSLHTTPLRRSHSQLWLLRACVCPRGRSTEEGTLPLTFYLVIPASSF